MTLLTLMGCAGGRRAYDKQAERILDLIDELKIGTDEFETALEDFYREFYKRAQWRKDETATG